MNDWQRSTQAIRVGRSPHDVGLAPTLHPSAAFRTATTGEASQLATSPRPERFYGRFGNPSVAAFESAIAELEGAAAARAYASGMAAICGVVFAVCSAGDHVVAQRQIYSGTHLVLQAMCARFGIDVTFVDGTSTEEWHGAIRPGKTMLCLAETPANPNLDIVDLSAFGAIAGPITAVDSTFATPLLQRPHEYGVDLVIHSATKGISGHNDATLGVVTGSGELIDWLWGYAVLAGAVASPFDATNALRGLRTLPVRLERQCATAHAVASFLETHEAVSRVRYPGLLSHPGHALAATQMSGFGSLITIELRAERDAREVLDRLDLVQLATSLGGPESLATHPASTTHAGLSPAELEQAEIGPGTIRISIGLESSQDLICDFEQALRSS